MQGQQAEADLEQGDGQQADAGQRQLELNALLKSNQEIVERARTHVGNLAHALKTPLAVMVNEAREIRPPSRARWPSRPSSCTPRSTSTWSVPAWPPASA